MADFLYFYLRGAIGFSLIVAGIASRMPPGCEKGQKAFGGLFISVGALYTMSAMDPEFRLPVDLDNLVYQGLMFLLGLSFVDLALYLFGSERIKGGRRTLVLVGGVFQAALVLLPLLDYLLALGPRVGNVEDGILRGPLHAAAIEASYAWPLLATAFAIGMAKWRPTDLERQNTESRKLITWIIIIVPLLVVILAALVLSIRPVYRWGQIVVEGLMVSWYLYVVRKPESLRLLREEIGQEHTKRLSLAESEVSLIEERLARVEAERQAVLGEDFDLRKLAAIIGVPAYRLSAYFSDHRDTTFPAWRNSVRIEFVKERLLERPDLTILDVSLEAGYRSKAAFNDQFIRIVGQSPSEFRKSAGRLRDGFAN